MKQYLLMCDEAGKAILEKVMAVQFLEVQGLIANEGKYNLLVSPIPQVEEKPPQLPESLQEPQNEQ